MNSIVGTVWGIMCESGEKRHWGGTQRAVVGQRVVANSIQGAVRCEPLFALGWLLNGHGGGRKCWEVVWGPLCCREQLSFRFRRRCHLNMFRSKLNVGES